MTTAPQINPEITVKEYTPWSGDTCYSIRYGNPDGHAVLVTPDKGSWVVWHSDSLNTISREFSLDSAIERARRAAVARLRKIQAGKEAPKEFTYGPAPAGAVDGSIRRI